ncbi:MAG: HD domain-containing protein [Candidatus Aenigmatarchaeota archaeon]
MKPEQLQKIEALAKSETANPASITHAFDHLHRVAEGAAWFVRVNGGNEEQQLLARAAGLLHDIIRPPTQKIDHVLASTARAEEILKGMGCSDADRKAILQAIRDHGGAQAWSSPLHESVFFADKVFEQAGAFVAFRRGAWMAESRDVDRSSTSMADATIAHYERRIASMQSHTFSPRFSRIVSYQMKLITDFFDALKAGRPWAARINKAAFEAGKARTPLEDFIRGYRPAYAEDLSYREEAIAYIEGRLWGRFEAMIRR